MIGIFLSRILIRDIAKYAADHNLVIISDDGDMFVMSKHGVILLNDCIHRAESLLLYHREMFINHFQVTLNHLIYLSLLTGNDFIKPTSLRGALHLQEEETQTFSHCLVYVTEHLKKNATYEEIEDDYCNLHSRMENPRDLFRRVFEKYNVSSYPLFPYSLFTGVHSEADLLKLTGCSKGNCSDSFQCR